MNDDNEFFKLLIVLVDPNTLDSASLLFFLTINNKSHISNCSFRDQILKTLSRYFVKTEETPNSEIRSGLPILITHSFKQDRLFIPLKHKFITGEKIAFDEICTAQELQNVEFNLKDRPPLSNFLKTKSDISKFIRKLIDNRYGPFFKINVENFNNKTEDQPITLQDHYFLKSMPTLMDTIEYTDSVRGERSLIDVTIDADQASRKTASIINEIIGENERSQLIDQETEIELQRPKSEDYWDQNGILETNKAKIDKPKIYTDVLNHSPKVLNPRQSPKLVALEEAPTPRPRSPMKFTLNTPYVGPIHEKSEPARVLENLKQITSSDNEDQNENYKLPVFESTKYQKKPYKLTSVVKLPIFDSNTIDLPKQYLDRFLRTLEINLSVGTITDLPINHIKHLLAENIKQKDKSERFIDITRSAKSLSDLKKGFLEAVSVPIQIKQKQFEAISSKPEGLSWAEFALSVINKFKNTYDHQDLNDGNNEFLLAQFMKCIPKVLKTQLQGYLLTTPKRNIYDISDVLDLIQANTDVDSITEKLRTCKTPEPANPKSELNKSKPENLKTVKFDSDKNSNSSQKFRQGYRENNNSKDGNFQRQNFQNKSNERNSNHFHNNRENFRSNNPQNLRNNFDRNNFQNGPHNSARGQFFARNPRGNDFRYPYRPNNGRFQRGGRPENNRREFNNNFGNYSNQNYIRPNYFNRRDTNQNNQNFNKERNDYRTENRGYYTDRPNRNNYNQRQYPYRNNNGYNDFQQNDNSNQYSSFKDPR